MVAIRYNRVLVIEELINFGVNLHIKNNNGWDAKLLSAQHCNDYITRLLEKKLTKTLTIVTKTPGE